MDIALGRHAVNRLQQIFAGQIGGNLSGLVAGNGQQADGSITLPKCLGLPDIPPPASK